MLQDKTDCYPIPILLGVLLKSIALKKIISLQVNKSTYIKHIHWECK